jgi:hypothetical protein
MGAVPERISFLPPKSGRPSYKAAFFWFFFGAAQPKKNPAGRATKNMEERQRRLSKAHARKSGGS